MKPILTLALLATTACTNANYRPYTIMHADGSYTRTDTRPTGEPVAICERGPARNVDLINRQTTHSADITDTRAQIICADTIR